MYIAVLYMIRLFMHQSPPKIPIPMIIDILTAASFIISDIHSVRVATGVVATNWRDMLVFGTTRPKCR